MSDIILLYTLVVMLVLKLIIKMREMMILTILKKAGTLEMNDDVFVGFYCEGSDCTANKKNSMQTRDSSCIRHFADHFIP